LHARTLGSRRDNQGNEQDKTRQNKTKKKPSSHHTRHAAARREEKTLLLHFVFLSRVGTAVCFFLRIWGFVFAADAPTINRNQYNCGCGCCFYFVVFATLRIARNRIKKRTIKKKKEHLAGYGAGETLRGVQKKKKFGPGIKHLGRKRERERERAPRSSNTHLAPATYGRGTAEARKAHGKRIADEEKKSAWGRGEAAQDVCVCVCARA